MTNAEARCNKSLRPRKPEGSLGRTAQDVHLDSHTAPELCCLGVVLWPEEGDILENLHGVVCVIINKRSFESFMCLSLILER